MASEELETNSYTKLPIATNNLTEEPAPGRGKGGFGIGRFGTAKFGQIHGLFYPKEGKSNMDADKEALPSVIGS